MRWPGLISSRRNTQKASRHCMADREDAALSSSQQVGLNRQLFLLLTYKDGQRDSIPKVKPRHLDCPHVVQYGVLVSKLYLLFCRKTKKPVCQNFHTVLSKVLQSFDAERQQRKKKPWTRSLCTFLCMRVYSWACALLWKRSLFPRCVPGIEAARDLQVNKPETRGTTKHTRTCTYVELWGWCFPDAPSLFSPSYIAWHSRPLRSSCLPHTHTHTHTHTQPHYTSPISLNPAYQSFCFFSFPFPCTDKKQHSQVRSHSRCRLIPLVIQSGRSVKLLQNL